MKVLYHPRSKDAGYSRRFDRYGICDCCGKEVRLANFTNTCDCGADYNSSGNRLAPRSQWGEETGESLADILSVDCTDTETLLEGDY